VDIYVNTTNSTFSPA